jgi:hypothetical protein
VTVRQGDQHDEAGFAFDERGDGVHSLAEQQVAFPVAGHGPVVGFGGPLPNVDRAAELALPVHHTVAARSARPMTAAQIAAQFLA